MKRITTLFVILLAANIGLAQEEEQKKERPDTTSFTLGKVKILIVDNDTIVVDQQNENPDNKGEEKAEKKVKKDKLTYWSGFEVGINMLMNNQFKPDFGEKHLQIDPASSFVYNFNIMEFRIPFGTDHVGLVTGIGFTNSRFGFKDAYLRLDANADSSYGYADSSLVSGFNKNQLRVNYFNVPVLFQFNTSKDPKKNFHVAFGVIGGVRIGSNVKYKYDILGGEAKNKVKGRYNLNPFQAALTARVGYRNFGLFASYNMLPLFENDKSRVAKPLTFGASFHF